MKQRLKACFTLGILGLTTLSTHGMWQASRRLLKRTIGVATVSPQRKLYSNRRLVSCALGIAGAASSAAIWYYKSQALRSKTSDPQHPYSSPQKPAYSGSDQAEILDALLRDPQKALQKFDETKSILQANVPFDRLTSKESKGYLEQLEKECPLFLVSECTTPTCVLTRSYNPQYRQQFETYVVQEIEKQHQLKPESGTPVGYVSFASGSMFQDLVILTKALTRCPNACIDIHLIDTNYLCYTEACRLLGKRKSIDTSYKVTDNLGAITADISSTLPYNSDQIRGICYFTEGRSKQLLSYLQRTFPHSTLSLSLHSTAQEYLECTKQTQTESPDIVIAADIVDDTTAYTHGTTHYMFLCKEALKRNPLSQNIWLEKTDHGRVSLIQVSLQEGDKGPVYLAKDATDTYNAKTEGTVGPPVYISMEHL